MYKITPYSYRRSHELGLTIIPSQNPKKKIDVYDGRRFITSIGDIKYSDYGTYMISHGLTYATERRRLYYIRHQHDNRIDGIMSKLILW